MRCSAGMMCLNAKSPVIPKTTIASPCSRFRLTLAAGHGRRTARATNDGVSAPSDAPLREKRPERPAVSAPRRDAPPWSIPTTPIISETPNPNASIHAHRQVLTARAHASHATLPTAAPGGVDPSTGDDDGEVVETAPEARRAENDRAPVTNGGARGAAAGPANPTRERFDEEPSGAPVVTARAISSRWEFITKWWSAASSSKAAPARHVSAFR